MCWNSFVCFVGEPAEGSLPHKIHDLSPVRSEGSLRVVPATRAHGLSILSKKKHAVRSWASAHAPFYTQPELTEQTESKARADDEFPRPVAE